MQVVHILYRIYSLQYMHNMREMDMVQDLHEFLMYVKYTLAAGFQNEYILCNPYQQRQPHMSDV